MAIKCEVCGGNLQMQDSGGNASCVNCGMVYSIERVRSLINDNHNNGPAMPVTNKSNTTEDYLTLAKIAFENNENQKAVDYCDKAIETNVCCSEAWKIKALLEVDHNFDKSMRFFVKALQYASDKEKENITSQITKTIQNWKIGLDLGALALLDGHLPSADYKKLLCSIMHTHWKHTLSYAQGKIKEFKKKPAYIGKIDMFIGALNHTTNDFKAIMRAFPDSKNYPFAYIFLDTKKEWEDILNEIGFLKIELSFDRSTYYWSCRKDNLEGKALTELKDTSNLFYQTLEKTVAEEGARRAKEYWAAHPEEETRLKQKIAVLETEITKIKQNHDHSLEYCEYMQLLEKKEQARLYTLEAGIFQKRKAAKAYQVISQQADAAKKAYDIFCDREADDLYELEEELNEYKQRLLYLK